MNPRAKKLALYAAELVLIAVIIGLLVATWLPAMIGGNPNASPIP